MTARLVARYYYPGNEIVIHTDNRKVTIRDENGDYPASPVDGSRMPHPAEDDADPGVPTYEEIGLYYDYQMPETGWDGDA